MTTRIRHVAEYRYPGAFFFEDTYRTLDVPTLQCAVENGPDEDGYFKKDGWYAVEIKSITEKRYVADDGAETWVRDGEPSKVSYVVGRLVHFESPEIAGDEHSILRSNIRANSREPYKGYGVLTRSGVWQIASDYDEVVSL